MNLSPAERAEAEHVKIVCRVLSEEKTSGAAARLAGVSEGRWSHFASLEHLDQNLPLWRAIMIQQRSGRDDFTRLMIDRSQAAPSGAVDPHRLTTLHLSILADATLGIEEALADGTLTEAERRKLAPILEKLCSSAAKLKASIVEHGTNVTALHRQYPDRSS